MTNFNPDPPRPDDNSPAAVLQRTRKAYTDTGDLIRRLEAELALEKTNHERAIAQWKKARTELTNAIIAAKTDYQQWGRMLPRGDTARGNGTQ